MGTESPRSKPDGKSKFPKSGAKKGRRSPKPLRGRTSGGKPKSGSGTRIAPPKLPVARFC